jgi:signal transduction histidine kinase
VAKKKEKIRVYNRLFFKLYLNYAVMLLITALLISLIFIRLFTNVTTGNILKEMKEQAKVVSGITKESVINERTDQYIELLQRLEQINDWDIWVISNPEAAMPLDYDMEYGATYEDFEDTPELVGYLELLHSAFEGNVNSEQKYDEIYEGQTITVAYPVYGDSDFVVGVVMVKTLVEEQQEIVSSSLTVILISSAVALGISFVIVILFTTGLSIPISRMRATALELAAGNYKSKTGISRDDEIGDLANTVDILSDKLLENDIERKKLDQMRFDFFANVSHELRTPITVIRAYTETLADGVVSDMEQIDQYYNRMLSECKSMERLIADLLALSKMQNPDFTIEKEPVNLVQVFDDIIRSAGAIAEKKNISIEVTKNEPLMMVLGDYDRLRQMFMVILDNAIKFSKENQTVHINLSNTDKIRVSIKDQGIGIDVSDINYIFEKFYKSNLRQNASGTGLGLAIAKQISLKHEGDIEVISAPGEGTEFIFTLPQYRMEL